LQTVLSSHLLNLTDFLAIISYITLDPQCRLNKILDQSHKGQAEFEFYVEDIAAISSHVSTL